MTIEIFIANTDADIESCFPAFSALRPHLEQHHFIAQIRRQQAQSYQILALKHGGAVKSAAGFRFAEFLAWGKILYIDDLTTLPGETSQGFAGALLDWLIDHAQCNQCQGILGYRLHASCCASALPSQGFAAKWASPLAGVQNRCLIKFGVIDKSARGYKNAGELFMRCRCV